MSEWRAKRFWSEAAPERAGAGWDVRLDRRPVKTPAKAPLVVPTEALAAAIAEEWNAQQEQIDPVSMPLTRAANSAIDKVTPQRAEVAQLLAAYGETDLLCYRAEGPEALVRRQAEVWDPLLAWAAERLGAPLNVTAGVMTVTQPPESIGRLRAEVDALDPFVLTGFHDLVTLSGSLVIALAALKRQSPVEALWAASRIDETWQQELWGADSEAAEAAERKRRDFLGAALFLDLLSDAG